jgi:hypothetical protein
MKLDMQSFWRNSSASLAGSNELFRLQRRTFNSASTEMKIHVWRRLPAIWFLTITDFCAKMCAVNNMSAMTITKPERQTRRVVAFFTPSQEARLLALAKKHGVTAAEVLRQAFDQFVAALDSKRKSA